MRRRAALEYDPMLRETTIVGKSFQVCFIGNGFLSAVGVERKFLFRYFEMVFGIHQEQQFFIAGKKTYCRMLSERSFTCQNQIYIVQFESRDNGAKTRSFWCFVAMRSVLPSKSARLRWLFIYFRYKKMSADQNFGIIRKIVSQKCWDTLSRFVEKWNRRVMLRLIRWIPNDFAKHFIVVTGFKIVQQQEKQFFRFTNRHFNIQNWNLCMLLVQIVQIVQSVQN